jgi:hypothetical protein
VTGIDENGVSFKTSFSDSNFVTHDKIKAVELVRESANSPGLTKVKRDRLLTLPRMQRDSPPTHLIRSRDGDYLLVRLMGMDANRLQEGAAQLIALATAANRYVEETAPFKLAKQPAKAAELDSVLANLARTVARIAVLAQPFLPATAATIWAPAGSPSPLPLERVRLGDLEALDPAGRQVQKPPILFPKPPRPRT